jgi:hypothetical protein
VLTHLLWNELREGACAFPSFLTRRQDFSLSLILAFTKPVLSNGLIYELNGRFLKLRRCREVEDVEKSKQVKMSNDYEERIRTQRSEVDQLKQELSSCAATCRQLEQQQVRSASPAVWSSYQKAWTDLNPSLFKSAAETISMVLLV